MRILASKEDPKHVPRLYPRDCRARQPVFVKIGERSLGSRNYWMCHDVAWHPTYFCWAKPDSASGKLGSVFRALLRSLVKKAREVAEAPLTATMTAVEDSGRGAMPDRFPSLVWGLGTASLGGLRYGNHHPGWIDRGETRLTTMTATETASTALDRIQSVTS